MTTSATSIIQPLRRWWRVHAIAQIDHQAIVGRVREDAGWSPRYVFMILMAAGIAVLGLLLSSPAVIIGAMLISPLMGPIIGLGFALATIDSAEIRRSLIALGGGMGLAVLFCALVVALSPLQNVTPEIAARTRPNLFDLVVALFSALAGAYAMIRGREGTVVGVAIATALMPPLAVMGFGIATLNLTVLSGALLLFVTNFVTIALTAAMMARLYGFARSLSPRQTLMQNTAIAAIFLLLAVPLGLSLRQISWETAASRQAREAVTELFGRGARISQIDMDYGTHPMRMAATVLTPRLQADAQVKLKDILSERLGRPVEVTIEQYRVGTMAGDAEAAQLAGQQNRARDLAMEQAARLGERLALVAGVDPQAVLIDRDSRRATVTARPLTGAAIEAYRQLEMRVVATAPDWQVTLVPPAAPLPQVPVTEDVPDKAALDAAIWGARRLNLPLSVAGRAADATLVARALTAAGVTAIVVPGDAGPVRLGWRAPDEAAP